MSPDRIRTYIDKKILDSLQTKTPSEVRVELMNKCNTYYNMLGGTYREMSIDEISEIKAVRTRYHNLYIHMARKRIIDLYKVEIRDVKGWSNTMKFKGVLLKERILETAYKIPF
jgi:hypothetical protein